MKVELDTLVRQMVEGRILYAEAVEAFKKAFVVVLRDNEGNRSRTPRKLGMHRNTLIRVLDKLEINAERRPPQKAA